MRIAIVGTGIVGRTLGAAWAAKGHDVVVGTRDPEATRARGDWNVDLPLAPFANVAEGAVVVVNATSGSVSLEVLAEVGIDDHVVLDASNPLDFSQGFPPSLFVKDTDSLAEQIQRAHPSAKVVKALNTLSSMVMTAPDSLAEPTTLFVAGGDPDARDLVRGLLEDFGWTDIIEFDSITAARGLEMWLPLWVRLMSTLGTAAFNLRIVRPTS